jgi:PKD repeat protein
VTNRSCTGLLIALAIIIAMVLPTSAITISAGEAVADGEGAVAKIDLVLDEAPEGLSGFNLTVSLSDPSVGEIEGIGYPDWVSLADNSTLPAGGAWIKAVDMGAGENGNVAPGATGIVLATLSLRGISSGTSGITVTVNQMSDDLGENLAPSVNAGTFTVTAVAAGETMPASSGGSSSPVEYSVSGDVTTGTTATVSLPAPDAAPDATLTGPGPDQTPVSPDDRLTAEPSLGSPGIVADFSADVRSGVAPLTVGFIDLTRGDPTGWAWDFENDGVTDAVGQNPGHVYTTPGVYQVRLTASNAQGSATETKTAYITVNPPEADELPLFVPWTLVIAALIAMAGAGVLVLYLTFTGRI